MLDALDVLAGPLDEREDETAPADDATEEETPALLEAPPPPTELLADDPGTDEALDPPTTELADALPGSDDELECTGTDELACMLLAIATSVLVTAVADAPLVSMTIAACRPFLAVMMITPVWLATPSRREKEISCRPLPVTVDGSGYVSSANGSRLW